MSCLDKFETLMNDNQHWMEVSREQRTVWMEQTKVDSGSNEQNENGLHYLDHKYRLVASIEDLQAEKGHAVLVLVRHFANELHDDFLGELEVEIDPSGDNTVNVEITMNVKDPVYLMPVSEETPIKFSGQYWGFKDGSLTVGTSIAGVHVNESN